MNHTTHNAASAHATPFLFSYMLGMMAVLASILTAAMTLQYAYGELPCPLCLLQRAAMLGVCFGIMLQLRHGFTYTYVGISLAFAVLLLVIAVRQTLLDIYPRPGHAYIGSAVFGMHMPVWSVLIALCLITAIAVELIVWGRYRPASKHTINPLAHYPLLRRVATVLGGYVLLIGVINAVSVGVQCEFNQCHTFSYQLLDHFKR